MKVFKLYLDKDKETAWLNKMAAEGWAMTHFFAGLYTFEPCQPGEYVYQVDISNRLSPSNNYRNLMFELGIEIVQTWGFWIILRKRGAEGPFELYTDIDSQMEHYKKILRMFKICAMLELLCMILEMVAVKQTGSVVFLVFALILMALAMALFKIAGHTARIYDGLQEKKTGIPVKRNNMSPALMAGLLCNMIALLTTDEMLGNWRFAIQICAIVLMVIGIVQTISKMKEQ